MARVKVCGITCPEDAAAAIRAGADAVGVVCHANAPRAVGRDVVREVGGVVPPFVMMVLLFVDAPRNVVEECLDAAPHAWLQFHGSENPDFCQAFGVPYIKSCVPEGPDDVQESMRSHPRARSLLVDGGSGSGRGFNWGLVPPRPQRSLPLIVAGGLEPGNVAEAIAATDPDAVDVSSGVCKDGDPLRKDPAKITAFVLAARSANG